MRTWQSANLFLCLNFKNTCLKTSSPSCSKNTKKMIMWLRLFLNNLMVLMKILLIKNNVKPYRNRSMSLLEKIFLVIN